MAAEIALVLVDMGDACALELDWMFWRRYGSLGSCKI